jgi:hypothetical protein
VKIISSKLRIASIILIFLLPFLAYLNTLYNGFVFDDHEQILNNPYIQSAKNIPRIFSSSVWSFQEFNCYKNYYYRPMMHIAYMAEYHFFKNDPHGYHLVNILLHSINSLILFFLALLIFRKNEKFLPKKIKEEKNIFFLSFLTALLFSLHPINSEAVNWIAAITELDLTAGVMLSFYFYILHEEKPHFYYFLLSLFFFVFAILNKETAIMTPLVFMSYSLIFIQNENSFWKKIVAWMKKNYLYFLIIIIYFIVRFTVLGTFLFGNNHGYPLTSPVVLISAVDLFFRNLVQMIFPIKLSLFHQYQDGNAQSIVLSSMIVTILIVFYTIKRIAQTKKIILPSLTINKFIVFYFLFLLLYLLPTLNIFLYGFELSERYCYLPSIGFSFILSISLWHFFLFLKEKKKIISGIFLGLIFLSISLSFYAIVQRNKIWKDDLSLFNDAQKHAPGSPTVYAQLAYFYCHNNNLEKCQENFNTSLNLYQDMGIDLDEIGGYYNYQLGMAFYQNKNYDQAIYYLKESNNSSFQCSGILNYLGMAHLKKGNSIESKKFLLEAQKIDPENRTIAKNLQSLP